MAEKLIRSVDKYQKMECINRKAHNGRVKMWVENGTPFAPN